MARNDYTPAAGTRLFYDALGAAGFATQLEGVKKYGTLPGGNDRKEIPTTRADQVLEDGSPDFVEQTAPSYIDPGAMEFTVAGEGNINAALELNDGESRSWKVLFTSGNYFTFDGWIMKAEPGIEDGGEIMLNVKIRAISQPVYHYAAP